jgi:hypothetical protein
VRNGSDGSISGTLVNGTHSNAGIGGQAVTLQVSALGKARDVASATTDGQGRFQFDALATDPSDTYAVYTHYQSGLYSSNPLTLDATASQQTTLTAYDATTSDAALRVTSVTVLVRQPRPLNGLIGLGEFVSFHNSGNTAYVGSTAPANGLPMGLLRFALPSGASNVVPGMGFVGTQILQVSTGFGATATVPPGDSEFAFAYDMPYDGAQSLFTYKAEYPTDQVNVLVPPNMQVDHRDYSARGQTQAFGGQYQVVQATNLQGNATATLRLSGLPAAGQPSELSFLALMGLTAGLALLFALLVWLYVRRGALARVLRLVPEEAFADTPALAETHAGERQVLLRELLRLEREHAHGKLDEATYHLREREVRAALRALLAEEGASRAATPASNPSSSTAATATSEVTAEETAPSEARVPGGGAR